MSHITKSWAISQVQTSCDVAMSYVPPITEEFVKSEIANIRILCVVLVPQNNAEQGTFVIGTTATHCNILQHTATHYNILQYKEQCWTRKIWDWDQNTLTVLIIYPRTPPPVETMRHVTYEWVMPHISRSCHIWMSHVTHECVMSHMNESCHVWMNESCHIWMSHATYEWVMSHMNESCHTWTNESCQIWMSHVTYEWVMWHIHVMSHMN